MSKILNEFISKNNIDENILKSEKNRTRQELSEIVSNYAIYKDSVKRDIKIKDIVGSSEVAQENKTLYEELNYLFQDGDGGYHSRSNSMLEYTKEDIFNGLKKSFEEEKIHLEEASKGKYCVGKNGRHRCAIIKSLYLDEMSKAKSDEERKSIDEKYTIHADVDDIDVIKTYSNYILNTINSDIRVRPEFDENYNKTGKSFIVNGKNKGKAYTDEELVNIVREYSKNIPTYEFDIMQNEYKKDEYFKEYVDSNLSETIIKKKVSRESNKVLQIIKNKIKQYNRGER